MIQMVEVISKDMYTHESRSLVNSKNKENHTRYVIIKLIKANYKEKNLKSASGRKKINHTEEQGKK